jgi:hypothetical protein
MDFTEGFQPSSEVEELWGPGKLAEALNEQVSHVGFCKKRLSSSRGSTLPKWF